MIKIVSIAIVCAILIVYLKSINSDYFTLAIIAAGIIILSLSLEYISAIFEFINKIISLTGIDKEFYIIILKITAVGYLIEFSADMICDMGLKSVADKLVFVGKLVIFSMSMPIIYAVFNLLIGLIR